MPRGIESPTEKGGRHLAAEDRAGLTPDILKFKSGNLKFYASASYSC